MVVSSGSQPFGLRLYVHHWVSWLSILLFADLEISQPPELHEPIPYSKSLFICTPPNGSVFQVNSDY